MQITLNLTAEQATNVAYATNREGHADHDNALQMRADDETGAMLADARSALQCWQIAATLFTQLGLFAEARDALDNIEMCKREFQLD